MEKVNLLKGFFTPNSLKIVKQLQPRLQGLENELREVKAMENKIEAIIKLFQITSNLQDAGGFNKEIQKMKGSKGKKMNTEIRSLEFLQKHFVRAGRSLYGINRTTKGEEVTAEKVYLGGVFGISTKTAAYFLKNEKELKAMLRPDVVKNAKKPVSEWWIIHDYQCDSFVESHVNSMLKTIEALKIVEN